MSVNITQLRLDITAQSAKLRSDGNSDMAVSYCHTILEGLTVISTLAGSDETAAITANDAQRANVLAANLYLAAADAPTRRATALVAQATQAWVDLQETLPSAVQMETIAP